MRKGYRIARCKRDHDLTVEENRGRWESGKTYCVPCQSIRKAARRAREANNPNVAFDILEKKGDAQLCERIRLQAASIKELQERIDQLQLEKEVLMVQLSEARHPAKPRAINRPHYSGIPSTQRNRPGVKLTVGSLLARIS